MIKESDNKTSANMDFKLILKWSTYANILIIIGLTYSFYFVV